MDDRTRHLAESLQQAGWDGVSPALMVLGSEQRLFCLDGTGIRGEWPVSTGRAGFGNQSGSGCTPTGLHQISHRIGADEPVGRVFSSRVATDEVAIISSETADQITTRILWLDGLEPGINQGGEVDSHQRYIYIHGTTDCQRLGQPVSAGCVRMHPEHMVELFDQTTEGMLVLIVPA
ncbi:MAG: L,D-transpeptidase [Magnetococcales bacterium]|nr:L,D-transpeptidase [Magnetococcales bacterium]